MLSSSRAFSLCARQAGGASRLVAPPPRPQGGQMGPGVALSGPGVAPSRPLFTKVMSMAKGFGFGNMLKKTML
jgi:hypothetical protein